MSERQDWNRARIEMTLTGRELAALEKLRSTAHAVCEELEAAADGLRGYRANIHDGVSENTAEHARGRARSLIVRYEEAYAEARHLGLIP